VSPLAGTWSLVRFALRRDRVRIAVWIAAIVLLVLVTAASTVALYPTQQSLDLAAAAAEDNPAAIAFSGPPVALNTIGGQVAFQLSSFGLVVVALMCLLMVVRLTRTEEDTGRLEMIRSMAVGRYAPLASAAIVVGAMALVTGLLTTAALLGQGLEAGGSVVLGLSFTVLGFVFIGIAGVTAQVTENPRVAGGIAGGILGLAFVIRAIGDVGDGTVSWFSPIGLVQKAEPYGGDVGWPLLVALVLAVALIACAGYLVAHRDFGAGLIAPRPGPPAASRWFDRPIGLAVRQQRGAILWWGVAVLVTGITYGSIANSIDEFIADNEAMADFLASAGGASLVDSYLSTSLVILALVAAGAALQCALRVRGEETEGRVEMILATPTSRTSWLSSQVVTAYVGSALVLVVGGFGLGATYGAVIGDYTQGPRLMAASALYIPAVWVLASIAIVLFGMAPRASQAAWAGLAGAFVLAMFGTLLKLPGWVLDLSPFQHVPQAPAASVTALPIVVLTVLALAVTAVGFAGFTRRDIG
jgi:ABC-2 type transport system permease protein